MAVEQVFFTQKRIKCFYETLYFSGRRAGVTVLEKLLFRVNYTSRLPGLPVPDSSLLRTTNRMNFFFFPFFFRVTILKNHFEIHYIIKNYLIKFKIVVLRHKSYKDPRKDHLITIVI